MICNDVNSLSAPEIPDFRGVPVDRKKRHACIPRSRRPCPFFSHPLRDRHPSTQRCGGRPLQCRFGPGLQYLPVIHFQRMAQINQVGAFKAAHIPLNRRPRNAVSFSGNRLTKNQFPGKRCTDTERCVRVRLRFGCCARKGAFKGFVRHPSAWPAGPTHRF